MAVSISDLIARRDAIERQIHEAQSTGKSEAIAQVRKLMAEHGLTADDFVAKTSSRVSAVAGKKVAAKYRDPTSGASWTGRGLKPKWLTAALADGKLLEDFVV